MLHHEIMSQESGDASHKLEVKTPSMMQKHTTVSDMGFVDLEITGYMV